MVFYLQKVRFGFYPNDLANTKTTISLRVGFIVLDIHSPPPHISRLDQYIHHYSPPLRRIVV